MTMEYKVASGEQDHEYQEYHKGICNIMEIIQQDRIRIAKHVISLGPAAQRQYVEDLENQLTKGAQDEH